MDGKELIKNHTDDLVQLICTTSLWASKDIVNKLFAENNNKTASWYLNTRRYIKGNNEVRRTFLNDVYLDDNVCANVAIKKALGFQTNEIKNFNTCHIYDLSTYNVKYHASIPNLILVPNSIYALTDNSEECKNFLKYISFKLYGFYIGQPPEKPNNWNDEVIEKIYKIPESRIYKAIQSVDRRNPLKTKKT
ncbi:MAG: hypothetical protein WEA99_07020 [Brumimicrobium sp.]